MSHFRPVNFPVVRVSDRTLHESMRQVSEATNLRCNNVRFVTFVGRGNQHFEEIPFDVSQPFNKTNANNNVSDWDKLEAVLSLEGVFVYKYTYDFTEFNVDIHRGINPNNGTVNSPSDDLKVSFPHNEMNKALIAVQQVRTCVQPAVNFDFPHVLAEDIKKYYTVREQNLAQLESKLMELTSKITQHRIDCESMVQQRKSELDTWELTQKTNYDTQMLRLEAEHKNKSELLDKRRDEIAKLEKIYDRRNLSENLKTMIEDMTKKIEMDPATVDKRRNVWKVTILTGFILTVLWVSSYLYNAVSDNHYNWIVVGSQIVASASLIGLVTFIIKWQIQWFKTHADNEQRLKRMLQDTARAAWIVELALEWHNRTDKTDMPKELLDRLTAHLYESPMIDNADLSPLDALRSGLLGSEYEIVLKHNAIKAKGKQDAK